jgi:hypothetical protein
MRADQKRMEREAREEHERNRQVVLGLKNELEQERKRCSGACKVNYRLIEPILSPIVVSLIWLYDAYLWKYSPLIPASVTTSW